MLPFSRMEHDRLKEFITDLDISQSELGRKIHVTRSCIKHYLNRTVPIPFLKSRAIAALSTININPSWLRYESDKKYNDTHSPGLRISDQGLLNISVTHIEELVTKNHNLEIENLILRMANRKLNETISHTTF